MHVYILSRLTSSTNVNILCCNYHNSVTCVYCFMFESYFVMHVISFHIVKHLHKNDPRTI